MLQPAPLARAHQGFVVGEEALPGAQLARQEAGQAHAGAELDGAPAVDEAAVHREVVAERQRAGPDVQAQDVGLGHRLVAVGHGGDRLGAAPGAKVPERFLSGSSRG